MNLKPKKVTTVIRLTAFTLVAIYSSQNVFAQGSDMLGQSPAAQSPNEAGMSYSFGGACGVQGSWTQAALEQNHAIAKVINSIKDNPACSSLAGALQDVQAYQMAGEGGADPSQAPLAGGESLVSELAAVTNVANDPQLLKSAASILMDKTLSGALLATESTAINAAFTGLKSLGTRSARSMSVGLNTLEKMTSILPNLDTCLIGKPDLAGALFGATVKMAAAFASSGEGLGTRLGNSIAQLLTMAKNRKFTGAIRKLNQLEFWNSMSCLLETTTQAFCSAQDAQKLYANGVKEYAPKYGQSENSFVWKYDNESTKENDFITKGSNGHDYLDLGNPMVGYYVLTYHLPNISRWLQDVQFGVEPQWVTDGQFKNSAQALVNSQIRTANRVDAQLNEDIFTMNKTIQASDLKGRQNAILTAVGNMLSNMGVQPGQVEAGSEYFFTLSISAKEMPFYLLGIDKASQADFYGHLMNYGSWDSYVSNGGQFDRFSQFGNPDLLAAGIRERWRNLKLLASNKASQYYVDRVIVNKVNLALKALTDPVYSVYESLRFTNQYLLSFSKLVNEFVNQKGKWFDEDNADLVQARAMLPAVNDTMYRINEVLKSFAQIKKINSVMVDSPESSAKVNDPYQNAILSAFLQFDVLLQRDSYLKAQVGNFIKFEYSLRARNKINMGDFEQKLLVTSGRNILDIMTEIHGLNPSSLKQDLHRAQSINLGNIDGLEMAFRDSFESYMAEAALNLKTKAVVTDSMLNGYNMGRLAVDTFTRAPKELPLRGTLAMFTSVPLALFYRYHTRPDLYNFYGSTNPTIRSKDTLMRDQQQALALLCVQTLAFQRSDYFNKYCKGLVLEGAYNNTSSDFFLNAAYDKEATKTDRGDRICAFRDFNRRNLFDTLQRNLKYRGASQEQVEKREKSSTAELEKLDAELEADAVAKAKADTRPARGTLKSGAQR